MTSVDFQRENIIEAKLTLTLGKDKSETYLKGKFSQYKQTLTSYKSSSNKSKPVSQILQTSILSDSLLQVQNITLSSRY